MQRDRAPAGPGAGRAGWLVLLWTAWVLVPAGFFLSGVSTLITFLGEQPMEAEHADARQLFVPAGITAVAIPVLGLAVSLRARRPGGATAFGVVVAPGLIGAVVVVVGTARPAPRSGHPDARPGRRVPGAQR